MLTFLTVEKPKKKSVFFLRNKVYALEKETQGIRVKYIRYVQRAGRIRWDKIRKLCSDESDRLLSPKELIFPKNSGLMRFESFGLRERLCLNASIEVLRIVRSQKRKIRVAVYDPEGIIADSAEMLLKYADRVAAVTGMTGIYSAEAQRIMDERGAVLTVSRNPGVLSTADLVVAPAVLREVLPLKKQAVLLTVGEPQVYQKCRVFFGYDFKVSEDLENLVPEGFEKMYFMSALYTLCRRFDLGSVVPEEIAGECVKHTPESLAKYLINICENT